MTTLNSHTTARRIGELLLAQKAMIGLVIIVAVVTIISPNFLTIDNLLNVLRQTSVNAIIAVGMTLVIITAGIDLSVGSVLALCGAIAATLVSMELSMFVIIGLVALSGMGIGACTGGVIAIGRVQPFIATLVAMTLLRGVTLLFTDGRPVSTGFHPTGDIFAWFGTGYMLGIPVPVWMMALAFLAGWYLLNQTRLGRYIYAVGGNESAARLSGINVKWVKISVYGISGLMSGLAAIIVTSRLSSAQPTAGTMYELDAIAAVVIGGTSLAGGRGAIFGTLIGALIIGVLNNALNLLAVSSYFQMIVKAAVILLAVLADTRNK